MRDWKFNHIDFSTYPVYSGDDLGVFWAPEKDNRKNLGTDSQNNRTQALQRRKGGEEFYKTTLQADGNGTWSTILNGDYEGKFYTLRINDGDWLEEIPDIYARCVGVNGLRGMIYNPAKTNPEGWKHDTRLPFKSFQDAVIYEIHIRDFSVSGNSGIENKGKFLGFIENNTQSPDGLATGLSHLEELGITHVHLLPVNDFYTVDEENPSEKYNWGYDPLHYNALEGSYATNPYNGTKRIKEFKLLVQALHNVGIGVVLDVVYNHTYFAKESVLNQTVPGYFYRQKPDGSFANATGCGNELATERTMVRKYIIDSLKYWADEFHIDGFRFDLMGVYDLDTMNAIRRELPGLLLYGEGWTADKSPMPESLRAVKTNMSKLPGIAAFNDDFRDALKGNDSLKKSKGFISGLSLREEPVKFGVVGAVYHPQIVYNYVETSKNPWASQPDQCVNYASCHDNYTLWDKLKFSCPKASDEEMRKMVKLAGALVLTSQGIPFLHGGVELCYTKGGNPNSYKSPDTVNQIDWERKKTYYDVFEYYRNLILLRKKHPAFRMTTAKQIQKNISFCADYKIGIVSYCINGAACGDTWKEIVMLFNGTREDLLQPLPEGSFRIAVQGDNFFDDETTEKIVSENILLPAVSMVILVKE